MATYMTKNQEHLKEETVLRNVTLCDGSANSWAGELEIICTAKLLECNIIINWLTESESFVKIYGGIHRSQSYNVILQFKNDHFQIINCSSIECTCGSDALHNLRAAESESEISSEGNIAPKGTAFDCHEQANQKKSSTLNTPKERPVSNVFNLSSKTLTPAQLSVLSKGLKFIPTSDSIDITKLIADIKEWEKRMRLREYFYDVDNDDSDDEEAIPKKSDSHWTPPVGCDK